MPSSLRILVVEDDPAMRMVLETRLEEWGCEVLSADDGAKGKRLAESQNPDIVLSDVVLPGMSGLELLQALKAGDPARPVILMTAQGSVDKAVEAMKQGAQDFLTKPLDYAKLRAVLEAVQQDLALRAESRKLNAQLEREPGFGLFVGKSKAMRDVYSLLEKLASKDVSAIITGESGTGKEIAARAIHDKSKRADGPFIAINAAAIPENLMESEIFGHEKGAYTGAIGAHAGCFEQAHQGTLFLDEITEMPMPLQPKLLRVLEGGLVRRLGGTQELAFDVRVIAATNREPKDAVVDGQLREDLFYRLNVFTVTLPPLRERKEDIPTLVQHFIRQSNEKHSAAVEAMRPDALGKMKEYGWPGNVRELKNVVERAVIVARGEWIEISHLPPFLRGAILAPPGATLAESEKELILKTLEETGNNKAETARRLKLDVKTIRNKLKSYGM